MDSRAFTNPSGRIVKVSAPTDGHQYSAFIPAPLPPPETAQAIQAHAALLADAEHKLGLLQGIGSLLRNPNLLVFPYMRQEAVSSSRIEGTRASFIELLAFEVDASAAPGSDVVDVRNYLNALRSGLSRVAAEGVTPDLVRDLHLTLMRGARGEGLSYPGEFRFSQNQVRGASSDPADAAYVPPPAEAMQDCLVRFFAHLASPSPEMPPLVDIAWAHYQFEAIHPFQDGNGRVGRLLVPLLLSLRGRMEQPLLYLSPYFDRHRSEYYDFLFAVSAKSTWSDWLQFFLTGIVEQATNAASTARKVIDLGEEWGHRLRTGRMGPTAERLSEIALQHIVLNAETSQRELAAVGAPDSLPTVYRTLNTLVAAGILTELTGQQRGRLWYSRELAALLDPA